MLCVVGDVVGVTLLHDVVYMVCARSSTITRFNATTRQRLTDMDVKGLEWPHDIAACERTSQVYIADLEECVWRVSTDGTDTKRWPPPQSTSETFTPSALSVTSTRLLVTSRYTCQLIQFDADGDELRRVQLPDHMEPWHAVESPTGTFIVSLYNMPLNRRQVVDVNTGGEVLRQFSGSKSLGYTPHVAVTVDSEGNVLVADSRNSRIQLLDAQLSLRRVIIDEQQLNNMGPLRLCYHSGQLLVAMYGGVAVFDVLCR